MSKDLNEVFDELLSRYIKAIEKDYLSRYKKAKDKDFIIEELTKATDFAIGWEEVDLGKGKLIMLFSDMYKRGENMDEIIAHLRKTFGGVADIKPFKLIENGKKITLYLSEEEKALKKLALNERKLFKVLIRNTAFKAIKTKLPTMFEDLTSKTITSKQTMKIKWTGSETNKNEFVQLIYGLNEAGLIDNGKGEITKITEALAGTLGLDLGKNWQSNHSASIHKAKMDYQPPIFDKIKDAYLEYSKKLVYEKKQKK
jgi:hypothetical protein